MACFFLDRPKSARLRGAMSKQLCFGLPGRTVEANEQPHHFGDATRQNMHRPITPLCRPRPSFSPTGRAATVDRAKYASYKSRTSRTGRSKPGALKRTISRLNNRLVIASPLPCGGRLLGSHVLVRLTGCSLSFESPAKPMTMLVDALCCPCPDLVLSMVCYRA